MIWFVLGCALMLLLAFGLLARPLLLPAAGSDSRSGRISVWVLTSLVIGSLTSAVYVSKTNWSWQSDPAAKAALSNEDNAALEALRTKAQAAPDDVNAWLELGRGYTSVGNYALAGTTYQHVYDLTQGRDIDAVVGLAEALLLADQTSINGRVGLLIEQALKLQPNHPKALWYGGMVALQTGNLPLARDRFSTLLTLNPPQQVRSLLERQIQDISQQLGEVAKPDMAAAATSARKIVVKVTLSAALKQQLQQPVSLFVLARNPKQPGPPLAVQRHLSNELPLQLELTTADAMLPTRSIANAQEIEIVARLSASGMPTEQSGDYFGSVPYSFVKQGEQGSVAIEINQRVP